MKRGITINLSNKTFYTLIAIILLLVISGIAIATLNPAVPNPGHKISELQNCTNNGETLVMVNGNWACGVASGSNVCIAKNTSIGASTNTNPHHYVTQDIIEFLYI